MSEISPAFNITPSSLLQSYLTTSNGTGTDVFSTLNNSGNNAAATKAALSAGALTNRQHRILSAIGDGGAAGTPVPFNTNGTEPSALTDLRTKGWIKLVKKSVDPGAKTSQGIYALTAVGKAIYQRAGGASVSSSADDSSTLNSLGDSSSTTSTASQAAAAQATLQNSVSTAASLLTSVGVNIFA